MYHNIANQDIDSDSDKTTQVPFFSSARFGPGMVAVLSILIFLVFILALFKLYYLAILPAIVATVLFAAKYAELITTPEVAESKLIGEDCLVIRKISRGERGVVRIRKNDGRLDPELWSAELSERAISSRNNDDDIIEVHEDEIVRVVALRGIILEVEPQTTGQ